MEGFLTLYICCRSGSITEDGITTRYREETRENGLRRESLARDSIRENSILDVPRRAERELSSSRSDSGRINSLSVAETVAEMRNKYSPANYVPAVYRRNENVSRSKSINDMALPPIDRADNYVKRKVKDDNASGLSQFSNNTNRDDNFNGMDDSNGNRPSVSEIRKKFDARGRDKWRNGEEKWIGDEKSRLGEERSLRFGEDKNRLEERRLLEGRNRIIGEERNRNGEETSGDENRGDEKRRANLRKESSRREDSRKEISRKDSKEDVREEKEEKSKGDRMEERKTSSSILDRKKSLLNDKDDSDKVDGSEKQRKKYKSSENCAKLKVSDAEESGTDESQIGRSVGADSSSETDSGESGRPSRTNNFASYIPNRDFKAGDGSDVENNSNSQDMDKRRSRNNRLYVSFSAYFLFLTLAN